MDVPILIDDLTPEQTTKFLKRVVAWLDDCDRRKSYPFENWRTAFHFREQEMEQEQIMQVLQRGF